MGSTIGRRGLSVALATAVIGLAVALIAGASSTAGAQSIEGVGQRVGRVSVSRDGSTVAGFGAPPAAMGGGPWSGYRYRDGVLEIIPDSIMFDTNANGDIVVGSAYADTNQRGAWWDGTMHILPDISPTDSPRAITGVSPDGVTMVGTTDVAVVPFVWDGVSYYIGPGGQGIAEAISEDGSVIVGFEGLSAFKIEDGVRRTLWSHGASLSMAQDVSRDGGTIVGIAMFSGLVEAVRWRGGMTRLGDLPEGDHWSWANSVSGDGTRIVGAGCKAVACDTGLSRRVAIYWTEETGMVELESVVTQVFGLDLQGWSLLSADDLSDDGRTIVGAGLNPQGQIEAFLIRLPLTIEAALASPPLPVFTPGVMALQAGLLVLLGGRALHHERARSRLV